MSNNPENNNQKIKFTVAITAVLCLAVLVLAVVLAALAVRRANTPPVTEESNVPLSTVPVTTWPEPIVTSDGRPHILDEKNVKMLTQHKVFSLAELKSRCEIQLENYSKTVLIEAGTMIDMARKQILPAVESYTGFLARTVANKKAVAPQVSCGYETSLIVRLSELTDRIAACTDDLEKALNGVRAITDAPQQAASIRDTVLEKMARLRCAADEAESLTAQQYWPFPTYGELLFGVR